MTKPYSFQIKRLKWIIKNWELIRNNPSVAKNKFFKKFNTELRQRVGLCKNCDLDSLPYYTVYKSMMKSFSKFSGSIDLPLEDYENYSRFNSFTDTHERLELAKHCLKYLKNLRKKELKK